MIDSHCHLADNAFRPDVAETIARARDAGVRGALCILDAADPVERNRAADLAALWPALRFSAGVHPHHAAQWAERPAEALGHLEAIRAQLGSLRAVGEIGLDYHYRHSLPPAQRVMFAAQLAWAVEHDLPIVVHSREADEDTIAVVRDAGRGSVRGVMHCFSGTREFARQALDLGFYISFAGIVTFPNANGLREVAAFVPEDRLLAETDCPYLAPVPHRGKRNEPAWVVRVVEQLAELRGVAVENVAQQTTVNYETLFAP